MVVMFSEIRGQSRDRPGELEQSLSERLHLRLVWRLGFAGCQFNANPCPFGEGSPAVQYNHPTLNGSDVRHPVRNRVL